MIRRPRHRVYDPRALSILTVLTTVFTTGLTAACSGDPERVAPPTVPDGAELVPGLSLAPGSGFGATPWTSEGDCSSGGRVVTDDRDAVVRIAMWPPECVVTEGLNGTFQRYNSVADVDGREVAAEQVTAGTAHVFSQTYTECTNSCTDFAHRIVLLELDEPLRPDLPTVMISTTGDVPVRELVAIADAIRTAS
jgi:hypothetical protein